MGREVGRVVLGRWASSAASRAWAERGESLLGLSARDGPGHELDCRKGKEWREGGRLDPRG